MRWYSQISCSIYLNKPINITSKEIIQLIKSDENMMNGVIWNTFK